MRSIEVCFARLVLDQCCRPQLAERCVGGRPISGYLTIEQGNAALGANADIIAPGPAEAAFASDPGKHIS